MLARALEVPFFWMMDDDVDGFQLYRPKGDGAQLPGFSACTPYYAFMLGQHCMAKAAEEQQVALVGFERPTDHRNRLGNTTNRTAPAETHFKESREVHCVVLVNTHALEGVNYLNDEVLGLSDEDFCAAALAALVGGGEMGGEGVLGKADLGVHGEDKMIVQRARRLSKATLLLFAVQVVLLDVCSGGNTNIVRHIQQLHPATADAAAAAIAAARRSTLRRRHEPGDAAENGPSARRQRRA